MELAEMLGEELPEHPSFEYTYKVVEGRMAFLEWYYEDANVRVKDGAVSNRHHPRLPNPQSAKLLLFAKQPKRNVELVCSPVEVPKA
jgi:hypothetical protein